MERVKKHKPAAWVGIDPGADGAAMLISDVEGVLIYDYDSPESAASTLTNWNNWYDIRFAVLEKVHSMPKQGVSSVFKFGTNWGIWQGILAALKIPNQHVTPQKWQKASYMPSDGKDTKERSLNSARRLWPGVELHLKKHNGRSDALHMAQFAKSLRG